MSGAGGCVAPPSRAGWPGAWGSDPAPVGLHAQSGQLGARRGARRPWRWWRAAPRRLFLAGSPRRPKDGPRDGVREVPGPRTSRGSAHCGGGARGFWKGSAARPARGQRESPSGAGRREGADASRRTALGAPGALSLVRDRVRELSEASPREVFGSAPLEGVAVDHFLPHQRSGRWPRSPSTDSEMAPAEVAGAGRWGRVWAHWACGQSNPAGTAWASGVSRGFWWSSREAASALKQTCTLNSPSSPFPWPQKRPPLDRSSPPAWCGTLRQLFAAGRASQQELCCAGVACRGVCRVSLKNNLWRPPALAVCT